MQALLENQVFMYCAMAVLVFAVTQALKWILVKPWTAKIENERVRKAINTVVYFFPYFVGIALEYVYSVVIMKGTPNMLMGAINGGAAHSVYALYEQIYNVVTGKVGKKTTQEKTDFEKAIDEFVYGVVEDGKIDMDDTPKLKAFLERVGNANESKKV